MKLQAVLELVQMFLNVLFEHITQTQNQKEKEEKIVQPWPGISVD